MPVLLYTKKMNDIDVCSDCYFTYGTTDPKDVTWHEKYHDEFINGVQVKRMKSEMVLDETGGLRIVLINPLSTFAQRKRVEQIALYVNREMDFDFLSYHADDTKQKDSPLAVICINSGRAVGLLVLRMVDRACRTNWTDYEPNKEVSFLSDRRWGIFIIWVLKSQRRKGYAELMTQLALNYIGVSIADVAWVLPFSKEGEKFARSITQSEIYITW